MSFLLKGGVIVTQNGRRDVVWGDVLIEADRIAAVGRVRDAADEVIDCSGCVVMPGLVNAHAHAANTLLRGRADDRPLEAMLEVTFAADAKLTRRDVQVGALLGCLEMLRGGVTSFVDHFYWEDEVAKAVRESGIRAWLGWAVLDDAYTTQKGSPLKNAAAFVRSHRGQPRVTPLLALQGVYVCSEETYAGAREVADREDTLLHTHLSETRPEVYNHRKKTGLRPVEWLDKIGFLNNRLTAAHCVWVTVNEVKALARHGVAVAHCPVSNLKLASGGVAPLPEMFEHGVTVALGTDSPVSNNGMDLLRDLRDAALLHKAHRWDAAVFDAQRVLDLATLGGARALKAEKDLGSVEVGKKADLAVVDFRRPHLSPWDRGSAVSHLVYAATGADVRDVVVDGNVVVRDGTVQTVDAGSVVRRANEVAAELFGGKA